MSAAGSLWRYGRIMTAADESGERDFLGFLEPLSGEAQVLRTKAGAVSRERFRLIAEPGEGFSAGLSTRVLCAGTEYRLLSIRDIYAGEVLSHRECVLRKAGSDA